MPKIYGGAPMPASLREEEIAEASFTLQDSWGSHSKSSSLRVGTLRVDVRREPRGWVGVVHDMDAPEGSREVWRDVTVWIEKYEASWRAERWLLEHGGTWRVGQVRYWYYEDLDGSCTKYREEDDGSSTVVGKWASWTEMEASGGDDE